MKSKKSKNSQKISWPLSLIALLIVTLAVVVALNWRTPSAPQPPISQPAQVYPRGDYLEPTISTSQGISSETITPSKMGQPTSPTQSQAPNYAITCPEGMVKVCEGGQCQCDKPAR